MKQFVLAYCAVVWFALVASSSVQARPRYKKCYEKVFEDEVKILGGKMDCNLCHQPDKEKRFLNDYGRKLEEALGEKNVQDEDKVMEALRKIGPHPIHKRIGPRPPSPDLPPPVVWRFIA